MNIKILNSVFIENSALENGGAIYQKGNIDLTIINSSFIRNKAKTGGVLLVDCENLVYCKVNISDTTLEENYAKIASTIMSKTEILTVKTSI